MSIRYDEPGSRWSMCDPADVVELRELRSCHDCVYALVAFSSVRYCDKGKTYGKRCNGYKAPRVAEAV